MTLVDLIRTEASDEQRSLVVTASLAGASNAVIMACVHAAADSNGDDQTRFFVMGVLALALYVICLRRTYQRTTALIESALQKVKLRIVHKIEQAELLQLESIGASVIYDRLTANVSTISDSSEKIADMLPSACILVFAALYILSVSPIGFLLVLMLTTIGVLMWSSNNADAVAQLHQAGHKRVLFLDQLTDLLKGFKELRFGSKRRKDIRTDIANTVEELRLATTTANDMFNDNFILAQCAFFALLCAPVFILPSYTNIEHARVAALVTGVLFFWKPLGMVVGAMPVYIRSNSALENLHTLEKQLESAARNHVPEKEAMDPWKGHFSSIDVRNISFAYRPDAEGRAFGIGPINLTLAPAEVVFVVGGNGSGKSTFLKILTGLYSSSAGEIHIDGHHLCPENVAAYRELFSAIFIDFHLFSRLYGLLDVDERSVTALLQKMELDRKTAFENGRFTKRDLSTGQRKRLAMAVALLEDRPILLFDEWAADQDPAFRKYFYEELLPSLKAQGKTVLAVSHDDRYFHCADRIVTLEYGKVQSIHSPKSAPPAQPAAPLSPRNDS